jgi:hypothetical protein
LPSFDAFRVGLGLDAPGFEHSEAAERVVRDMIRAIC